jgi:hypothetical protein
MIPGDLEYLMSSLPELRFEHTGPTRVHVESLLQKYTDVPEAELQISEALNHEASKYIRGKRLELLLRLDLDSLHEESFRKSEHKLLSEFACFLWNLKKDLFAYRKSTYDGEPHKAMIHGLPELDGNPLENEIQLLQFMWDNLEEQASGQYSGFEALLIYKIQLLILERLWSFEARSGYRNYLAHINSVEV